jgi:uncharacterized protein
VYEVPEQNRAQGESFAAWVARVGDVLAAGHEVVYQVPFVHAGVRGIADFLERVDLPDGTFVYEPVDAKLARNEAKPGHVLQLCFYAESIAAQTGRWPEKLHIPLGSGRRETVRVADVIAYWRRLRGQLATLIADPPTEATVAEPCDHCGFWEFELVCDAEWRAADSLVHVAGVRRADRAALTADGITTIASLATLDRPVDDLDEARLERMVRQAALSRGSTISTRTRPAPTAPTT